MPSTKATPSNGHDSSSPSCLSMLNSRNILIMQSGGCTPVLNRSLYGIMREALARNKDIGEIYGARYGMEGILGGDLIDLRRTPASEWRRIARTPGAVLGSTRRKLRDEDVQPVLDVLRKHNIGCWFIIGGNDSATTGHSIGQAAEADGLPCRSSTSPRPSTTTSCSQTTAPVTAARHDSSPWLQWARRGMRRRWASQRR